MPDCNSYVFQSNDFEELNEISHENHRKQISDELNLVMEELSEEMDKDSRFMTMNYIFNSEKVESGTAVVIVFLKEVIVFLKSFRDRGYGKVSWDLYSSTDIGGFSYEKDASGPKMNFSFHISDHEIVYKHDHLKGVYDNQLSFEKMLLYVSEDEIKTIRAWILDNYTRKS